MGNVKLRKFSKRSRNYLQELIKVKRKLKMQLKLPNGNKNSIDRVEGSESFHQFGLYYIVREYDGAITPLNAPSRPALSSCQRKVS